ncbi:hypothetical protein A8W25_01260 [Streptomyces sp. ERV7]|nr:hypothetical protein A8W25_01260 [Streptomyces sp. ERV7]
MVVGGGLAGLELAKVLDSRGIGDVIVLDAGPADDLRHVNTAEPPEAALRMWLEPHSDPSFTRPWTPLTPPHFTLGAGLRRRLGGRSLYWYGVTLPIEPWALTEPWWPAEVIADLRESWRGGESLYTRVERNLAAWRTAGSEAAQTELLPVGEIAGLTLRATPAAIRPSALNPDRWYAYSPLDVWRDPDTGESHRSPERVRIYSDTEVLHVHSRNGAVHRVLARCRTSGTQFSVKASHVVLAAGTLENSRLALQTLNEDGSAVGEPRLSGLNDHIVQGFFLRLGRLRAEQLLAVSRLGNYFAPCEPRSNLFYEAVQLPEGEVLVDVRVSGEQLPSSHSHVEVTPGSQYPWAYRVHAATSADDRSLIAAQRTVLQAVWDDLAVKAGCRGSLLEFGDFDNPLRTNAHVLPEAIGAAVEGEAVTWSSSLGFEDHEGGTLPLGTVLTEQQELKGVQGLFAAGPAVFPRAGAANPALTTLALSHRLAAHLADSA